MDLEAGRSDVRSAPAGQNFWSSKQSPGELEQRESPTSYDQIHLHIELVTVEWTKHMEGWLTLASHKELDSFVVLPSEN